MSDKEKIINIAVIAHVDAGKSTLVDAFLRQSDVFRDNEEVVDCVMDSTFSFKIVGIHDAVNDFFVVTENITLS